jgi:iron-sulfur cluster repair protein YtfE (RIC family)
MTPSQLLAALAKQHADLRERISCCEQLADRFDAGLLDPSQLLEQVTALRRAFDEHNQFEERALSPVLLDADWLGAVRVARMVEDHIEEHRAIRHELATGPASELRAVLASLREHLETEERYFLTGKVLRDDLAG